MVKEPRIKISDVNVNLKTVWNIFLAFCGFVGLLSGFNYWAGNMLYAKSDDVARIEVKVDNLQKIMEPISRAFVVSWEETKRNENSKNN